MEYPFHMMMISILSLLIPWRSILLHHGRTEKHKFGKYYEVLFANINFIIAILMILPERSDLWDEQYAIVILIILFYFSLNITKCQLFSIFMLPHWIIVRE